LKRIFDYNWSISNGLKLITPIVDGGNAEVAVLLTNQRRKHHILRTTIGLSQS